MLTSTLTPSVSPLPPIDHVPSTSDLLGIDQSQRIQVALRIRAVNENRPSTSTLGAAHNHQKEMSMQSSPLSSSMSAAASEFSHQHSKSELLSPFSALKSLLSDSSSFSKLPLRSCIELKHSPPYQSLVIRDPEGRKRKKDYSYE